MKDNLYDLMKTLESNLGTRNYCRVIDRIRDDYRPDEGQSFTDYMIGELGKRLVVYEAVHQPSLFERMTG